MRRAILHRYPPHQIRATNAAYPYLRDRFDTLGFKSFNRLNPLAKLLKSILWVFYAPFLVAGKGYDVIYCDDSFPFYPGLVKLVSPKSRVVIRLGDLHLMYYTSGWVYHLLHAIEKAVWKSVDGIIAISDVMADHIRDEIRKPVRVVLDPVDPDIFEERRPRIRPTSRTVMFHGLLTRNKNVDLMLECAGRMPDVDFWVVGDGPDLCRLKRKAPQNVSFKGWQHLENVQAYICQCDVGLALRGPNKGNDYVVTSPFLQYGVMGKPCLVTRRPVFDEYPWQFSGVDEMVQKLRLLLKRPDQEGFYLKRYVLRRHNAKKIAEELWHILA